MSEEKWLADFKRGMEVGQRLGIGLNILTAALSGGSVRLDEVGLVARCLTLADELLAENELRQLQSGPSALAAQGGAP